MLRFVRIKVSGRVLGIAAVLTAAATLAGAAVPAQAATPGWRQVFTHHYGAANDASVFGSVVATSTSNAWALGGADESGGGGTTQRALAVHWNGHAWSSTLLLPATSYVIAASADSAADVWAVTFLGGYILHWNGSKWLVAKHLTTAGELTGVTALSPTNVWVFGGPGAFPGIGTWHLIGTTWHHVTGLATGVTFVSALSRSDMWAIGDTAAPEDTLQHYNGTTWQRLSSPALTGLNFTRILALSDTDVWVIGSPGGGPKEQLLHFDGTQWSSVPITVPSGVQLVSIASDGHGGLWFSGFGSSAQWAVHRSAAGTWSSTNLGSGRSIFDLALIPGTTSLWGAGGLNTATGADVAIWGHGPAA